MKMKKIDVHLHATMWNANDLHPKAKLATADDIRKIFEKCDIECGFVLPLTSPEAVGRSQSSEEAEYLSKNNPDILYWFCNVDPRMLSNSPKSDLSSLLSFYKERGAIGVGEITANMYTDDPFMDNLFYHCAECDLPATIHINTKIGGGYGIVDELGLPRLENILKKHPNLKILGHSQCFWNEIGTDVTDENRRGYITGKVNPGRVVELMRNYPNLYCDLSAGSGFTAISRDPEFSYRFIEEFSDRLMFGTDMTQANYEADLGPWLDAAYESGCISEENYRKICRENAIRIFKLEGR